MLFNGTGSKLVGTRVGTSQIDSLTVGSGGRLTAAPRSPFPAQGLGPLGSEFRLTSPRQLFVSNAHNPGAGSGTVSAFRDFANGRPDGSYLYADESAAGAVAEFAVHGGRLALLPGSPAQASSSPSSPVCRSRDLAPAPA